MLRWLRLAALVAFPSNTLGLRMVAQEVSTPAAPRQGAEVGPNFVYKVGGDVSAPVLISSVEPKMSEEARRRHFKGNVWVKTDIDKNGNPTHVRVIQGIGPNGAGLGLDESAVEAVKQFKFKPAMKNGKPVMVEMNLEVAFEAL